MPRLMRSGDDSPKSHIAIVDVCLYDHEATSCFLSLWVLMSENERIKLILFCIPDATCPVQPEALASNSSNLY